MSCANEARARRHTDDPSRTTHLVVFHLGRLVVGAFEAQLGDIITRGRLRHTIGGAVGSGVRVVWRADDPGRGGRAGAERCDDGVEVRDERVELR